MFVEREIPLYDFLSVLMDMTASSMAAFSMTNVQCEAACFMAE